MTKSLAILLKFHFLPGLARPAVFHETARVEEQVMLIARRRSRTRMFDLSDSPDYTTTLQARLTIELWGKLQTSFQPQQDDCNLLEATLGHHQICVRRLLFHESRQGSCG